MIGVFFDCLFVFACLRLLVCGCFACLFGVCLVLVCLILFVCVLRGCFCFFTFGCVLLVVLGPGLLAAC